MIQGQRWFVIAVIRQLVSILNIYFSERRLKTCRMLRGKAEMRLRKRLIVPKATHLMRSTRCMVSINDYVVSVGARGNDFGANPPTFLPADLLGATLVTEEMHTLQKLRMSVTYNAKPVVYRGELFPSITAFCTRFGLSFDVVQRRLKAGITDERLVSRKRVSVPPGT